MSGMCRKSKRECGIVEGRLAADDDEAPADYQKWLLMGNSKAAPSAEEWPNLAQNPRVCSFILRTGHNQMNDTQTADALPRLQASQLACVL